MLRSQRMNETTGTLTPRSRTKKPPQLQPTDAHHWRLSQPFDLNPGVSLEHLTVQLPPVLQHRDISALPTQNIRFHLNHMQCRLDRMYLQDVVARTLAGGGLSDLHAHTEGVRIELSGLLSREGNRTAFLVRGFLYEPAGPFGGIVFYDIRTFGRPGFPAPAIIPLLAARTGRQGPITLKGCVTLQIDLPALILQWGLAAHGWKIPSYRQLQLQQIAQLDQQLYLDYQPSHTQTSLPFAQTDPEYPRWMALCMAEQRFLKTETLLGQGDYNAALQAYTEASWREPNDPFLQERLMQLYISTSQKDLWSKAYRIAESILQSNPQSATALNCMAQYAEGQQDIPTAAHFYKQMGELAIRQGAPTEGALAFGKAAELLERSDPNLAGELWQLATLHHNQYRPALTALARYALKSGQFLKAEQLLQQLIQQSPPSIEKARYHLSLAGLYRSRLRDLENARLQLDLAAPYLSEDLPFLRELSEYRLATDENIEALRILDRLAMRAQTLKQPHLFADVLFRTGQILEERMGHTAQALARYREVLLARPKHAQAASRIQELESAGVIPTLVSLGAFENPDLLIREKQQALSFYKQIPTEQLRLYLELCRLFWQQQQVDQAIQCGYEALRLQSQHDVAWGLLEEICVRSERHLDLAAIHQQLAEQASSPEQALRHLEEALRFAPSDRNIIQHISEVYQSLQAWEKLDTLYSRWREIASPQERPTIAAQQALLRETSLYRQDQAELSFVQAFQLAQQAGIKTAPFLIELIQYYIRQQTWDKLDLQIQYLTQSLPPAEQAHIFAEYGKQLLAISSPTQQQQARKAYQKALSLAPHHLSYLQMTVTLLREERDMVTFPSLLQQLADKTTDPTQELSLRRELAHLFDQQLQQPDKARLQYKRIIELHPRDTQSLQRLASLYEQNQQWLEAAQVFTTLLPLLPPAPNQTATPSLVEHILLLFDQTQQHEAREQALSILLRYVPHFGHHTTPWRDQALAGSVATDNSVARAIAYYALGQQHQKPGLLLQSAKQLVSSHPVLALQRLQEGLSLSPYHPELWLYRIQQSDNTHRPTVFLELQNLFAQRAIQPEQQHQISQLFVALEQEPLQAEELEPLYSTLKQNHTPISSLSQLYARLLEANNQLDQALTVRRDLLQDLPDGREKTELRFELAIQQLRVLEDIEGGQQQLWQILVDDPAFTEAFTELQQLFDEMGDLVGFVEQAEKTAAQATPGSARAALYVQIFELYRALYPEPDDILAFLERNVSFATGDPHTLQLLAAAYEEAQSPERAVELYRQIGELQDPQELVVQALAQAAELHIHTLAQPDAAIDVLQNLLQKQPTHERGFSLLSEVYESLWMWDDLAALLEQYIAHLDDPELAAKQLIQLGEVYLGRLESYDQALMAYRRALRQTPKNIDVLRALQLLYEHLADWPAVVSALKAISRLTIDPKALCDIYMQIATLSLDRLSAWEDTEHYYQLAHTQQPERQAPLEGLIHLYNTTDQPLRKAQTAAILAILSAKQNNSDACQKALLQMVEGLQQLDNADSSPSPEIFLRTMMQERQESAALAQKIIDLLRDVADTGSHHEERVALHNTLRLLHQQQLQELSWLLRMWHLSEENTVSVDVAQQILQFVHQQNWSGIVQKLVKLQADAEPEEVASYQLSIAEIALHALKQIPQAQAFARRALTLGVPPERALAIFESIQQSEHNAIQIPALLAIAKESTPPDDLARACYHLGKIALPSHKLWAYALQCYMEAYTLTPHGHDQGTSLDLLQQMQSALAQKPMSTIALRDYVPATADISTRMISDAWIAFQLQQIEPGVECLKRLLQSDPNHSPALRILGQYLYQENQIEQATILLYHFLEREWDFLPFDEVVEICVSLAQLYDKQQNWDNAVFYLEQATQFIPEDPRILPLHIHVLKQSSRWTELQSLLDSHLQNPEPTDILEDILFQLGQLHEQQNQPQQAMRCYEQALQHNPDHIPSQQAALHLSQQPSVL